MNRVRREGEEENKIIGEDEERKRLRKISGG